MVADLAQRYQDCQLIIERNFFRRRPGDERLGYARVLVDRNSKRALGAPAVPTARGG